MRFIMSYACIFFVAIFLFIVCLIPTSSKVDNAMLNSVLWVQHAAEYKASTIQAYTTAKIMLDLALVDKKWTAATEQTSGYQTLPPAIIVDVDETVLDNSPYDAQLIKSGEAYSSDTWTAWCKEERAQAVPGALEFCTYAHQRGVTVFYVTNRRGHLKAATIANLQGIGFPLMADMDTVLPKTHTSDKRERRTAVAKNFRILLLIGDNAGDFYSGFTKESQSKRNSLIYKYIQNFGTKWIILPNPIYGDWESALFEYNRGLSKNEQRRIKYEQLQD